MEQVRRTADKYMAREEGDEKPNTQEHDEQYVLELQRSIFSLDGRPKESATATRQKRRSMLLAAFSALSLKSCALI